MTGKAAIMGRRRISGRGSSPDLRVREADEVPLLEQAEIAVALLCGRIKLPKQAASKHRVQYETACQFAEALKDGRLYAQVAKEHQYRLEVLEVERLLHAYTDFEFQIANHSAHQSGWVLRSVEDVLRVAKG